MRFPVLSDDVRLQRLRWPAAGRPVRAVLDTDTYNEVDDQFALAYALLAPERIALEAVYAAPFHNKRSNGPEDGMERSYDEIRRVLERLGMAGAKPVLKGSRQFLAEPFAAAPSAAAEDLVARALASDDAPLVVLAIGAITNVASAILLAPEIIERIVVVWLAGKPLDWPDTREFNLQQDPHASRLMFDCGVPLVLIPCKNVAEHLRTTLPELEVHLRPSGALGAYLHDIVAEYAAEERRAWSKVIWDISTVAWLLNERAVPTVLDHSPILTAGLTWSRDRARHLIRVATHCQRDPIFRDVFERIAAHARTSRA